MAVQGNRGALDIRRIGRSVNDGTNTRRLSPVPGVLGYQPARQQISTYNPPCDQVRELKLYVKYARMRRDYYRKFGKVAKNEAELDSMVNKAMEAHFRKDASSGKIERIGGQQEGGHYNPCSREKVIHNICKREKRKPICNWLTKGVNVHENTHERQAGRDWADHRRYCSKYTSDKDKAAIASKWEYEAYGEEIKVYEKILARLRREVPHCN